MFTKAIEREPVAEGACVFCGSTLCPQMNPRFCPATGFSRATGARGVCAVCGSSACAVQSPEFCRHTRQRRPVGKAMNAPIQDEMIAGPSIKK